MFLVEDYCILSDLKTSFTGNMGVGQLPVWSTFFTCIWDSRQITVPSHRHKLHILQMCLLPGSNYSITEYTVINLMNSIYPFQTEQLSEPHAFLAITQSYW